MTVLFGIPRIERIMPYNPQNTGNHPGLPQRRSIRLKGYDYAQAGAYFITICCQDRACMFGEVENGEMVLNDAGIMIDKWWQKIPEKFPDIKLDVYQTMPNHFHAIVINTGTPVGQTHVSALLMISGNR